MKYRRVGSRRLERVRSKSSEVEFVTCSPALSLRSYAGQRAIFRRTQKQNDRKKKIMLRGYIKHFASELGESGSRVKPRTQITIYESSSFI